MCEDNWIKHEQLDVPIDQVFTDADNKQTMREFILETEKEFELPHKNIDKMDCRTLNVYIELLDDLWLK